MPAISEYFVLFTITWIVSQTLKYVIRWFPTKKFSLKELHHIYVYGSGIPSSHSAVLTSSLLFVIKNFGLENPITYIFALFSMLWMYEMLLQRKRYRVFEKILPPSKITKKDFYLLKDLSGHDGVDICWGILVGTVVYLLANKLLFQ